MKIRLSLDWLTNLLGGWSARARDAVGALFDTEARAGSSAQLEAAAGLRHNVTVHHRYHVECYGRCSCGWGQGHHGAESWRALLGLDGNPEAPPCASYDGTLAWVDDVFNLVTTAGLNKYLDATLKTGLTTPAWFVGLVTGPGSGTTYAAGDTMASHAGWAEDATYSNATRPAFTPGTITGGSVDNSASKAVFNINGTATIAGGFLVDNSTKSGSTGTLLGEGDFTGGDRAVQNGDTLNVTVTATQA